MVRVEPLCKCCRGRSINYTAVRSTCGARALVLTSWQQQSTGANTHSKYTRARTPTHTQTHTAQYRLPGIHVFNSIDSRRAISDCVCSHASHLSFPCCGASRCCMFRGWSVLAVLESVRQGQRCGFIVLNNWNNSHSMAVRLQSYPQPVQPPIRCAKFTPRPALSPCRLWPSQDAGVQSVIEPLGGSGGQMGGGASRVAVTACVL